MSIINLHEGDAFPRDSKRELLGVATCSHESVHMTDILQAYLWTSTQGFHYHAMATENSIRMTLQAC